MLHVRLLGPLAVVDGTGRDLTPPGARERNGLATLAVVSPDPLSTERLAAELYRERATSDPRNAVQAMVSRLRRALGREAGAVETTSNGYRLVEVTLDVDEAERELRAALDEPDPRVGAELLAGAEARWRGPTLDGVDGDLIAAERLRIDGLRHDVRDAVLERRVEAGSAGGQPDRELLGDLEAAVRDDPLREKRWELLMLTLYRSGRQADALRAFQRARTVLGEELGLDPGPSLTDLEQRILAHDPTLDATAGGSSDAGDGTAAAAIDRGPGDHRGSGPTTGGGVATASTGTAPDAAIGAGNGSGGGAARIDGPPGPASAEPTLPSGTLTLVLCDVEGSVRRWEADPGETADHIEHLHRTWTAAVDDERGRVVKSTGDGLLAVFETAGAALRAVVAAHRAGVDTPLSVRTALHTGTLEVIDDDYRGPVVNRCARLLDLANGGQILLSGTTAALARPELDRPDPGRHQSDRSAPGRSGGSDRDGSIALRDLGPHWLRDVPEPMAVWQLDAPGLPTAFPPLSTSDPVGLPRLRAELLGREALVERVVGLVGDEPLVTLLGPGGIGKTSVALATGWTVAGGRPVTFVDLARVEDPASVGHRIADAVVGADRDDDHDPVDRVADRLRLGTDLVVIDNAEHLLDGVADLVDRVLAHQLKGSFLITSRQPLGLADEVMVGVPPLPVPTDDDDLGTTGRSPSVQLFLDRARSARPDLRIGDGLLPVVAHICRRLDGMPLAIELAAGRASLLAVDDIAARLDDQLRLLRQVSSSRERRHRSLEAVVRWSVDQLSPGAREAFARLSVMTSGFGLEGAEAVFDHLDLSGSGQARLDALEAIDELNGASLVAVDGEGSRFRMLEPVRQFAAAELAERGLEAETRRAHARWMIDLMNGAHDLRDHRRGPALARIDQEADHLRAAVTWIGETGQADLATEIVWPVGWWFLTRDPRTGCRLLGRLLDIVDREEDPIGWAGAVLGLGAASASDPGSEVAGSSLEALEVFDRVDHRDRGVARLAALFAQTELGDGSRLLELLAEAEELVPVDDRWARGVFDMAAMTLRSILHVNGTLAGDPDELLAQGRRAVEAFEECGEDWARGVTIGELGRLYQVLGRLEEAEACYIESMEAVSRSDSHGIHYIHTELGRLAGLRGDHDQALHHHREALRVAELDGNQGCIAQAIAGLAHAAALRGEFDEAIAGYREALELTGDSLLDHGRARWKLDLDDLLAGRTPRGPVDLLPPTH